MTGLSDSFGRPVNYLRLSVTERCNFRCRYCMPEKGLPLLSHEEILRYEEMVTVAKEAAALGISHIRITGGEPLVRRDIARLVEMLSKIKGIDDLSLTSNGYYLKNYAKALKDGGLKRVNVSLDSLKKDVFKAVTRRDGFKEVLSGIDAALLAGLLPLKVNVVVMREVNDSEVVDFASKSISEGWHVRFIELMPLSAEASFPHRCVPAAGVKTRIEEKLGQLMPVSGPPGSGPARYYRFSGASGSIGFISPVSEHFCESCNRLRLTARGSLRACLLDDNEVDLKPFLRKSGSSAQLSRIIRSTIIAKPVRHRINRGDRPIKGTMSRVGG